MRFQDKPVSDKSGAAVLTDIVFACISLRVDKVCGY